MESEKITLTSLIEFIKYLIKRTKKIFEEQLIVVSEKVLGRNPEYVNDFYYFRNQVFKEISSKFLHINPISAVTTTLCDLGRIQKISYDTGNRKYKYPSPICFFVNIPSDIRMLYRMESPYFDLQDAIMNQVMQCTQYP